MNKMEIINLDGSTKFRVNYENFGPAPGLTGEAICRFLIAVAQ